MTAAAAATAQSPFQYADKIFPDSYFGDTAPTEHHLSAFADGDTPSFKDLVDIVNPLQHIPVVSSIYRELTGDRPGAVARIAGGALYGGPFGLVAEEINCAIDDNTGSDVGGHVIAFLKRQFSDDPSPDGTPATELAAATPAIPVATPVTAPAPEPPVPAAAPQATVASESVTATAAPVAASPSPAPPSPTPILVAQAAPAAASPALASDANARFMPVPQRRSIDVAPMPLVRIPLSTTSQRSNVPITGRSTTAATASAATVQQAIAAQGAQPSAASVAAALSGTTASAATTANATVPAGPTPEAQWFASSMTQALDKYERSARLNKGDPQNSTAQ